MHPVTSLLPPWHPWGAQAPWGGAERGMGLMEQNRKKTLGRLAAAAATGVS